MKSRTVPFGLACILAAHFAPCGVADEEHTPKPYENYSVLVVKRIPIAADAVQEFGKISGIENVFVNTKARRVTLKLKPKSKASDLAIWQTAEELKLEPYRLVTLQKVYTSRPDSGGKPKVKAKSRSGAAR